MKGVGSLLKAFGWVWTWKMAWRDSRRSRWRLLLSAASMILGVAALIAVGSVGENLRDSIEVQAKTLLGADMALASNNPFTQEEGAFVAKLGGIQAREVSFSSMLYFPRPDGARLGQVRALEGDFPFYGTFETSPATAAAEFRSGTSALVDESLMKQFGLVAGDEVRVGERRFTIRGALRKAPGEVAAFSTFAPRVYIPMAELESTGLLGKGSLVRHRIYFKFDSETDVPRLVERIRPKLVKFQLDVDTVEHRKRELGRAMTNLSHFLNLAGFVALILGGIGIASAIHLHVQRKVSTVAVLRSVGCTASQAFAIYLAQSIVLGLIGVTAGAVVGVAIQSLLPVVLADFVPFKISASVSWPALARGAGLGMAVCLLFAALPLLGIRRVPPLAVLRSVGEGMSRKDPLLWVLYAVMGGGFVAFAISQAEHWWFGLAFAGGVGVAFGALAALAKGVAWLVRRHVSKVGAFTWRQGLASLHRPNNRTVLLMLSLGLGTFLILTLYLVQANLVREIVPGGQWDRPDAVLYDIQPDQREGVIRLLGREGLPVLQDVPVVTMRLAEIKGRTVAALRRDPDRSIPGWALRREYRSTYRDRLIDSETLIAGIWHERAGPDGAPVPVSVEEGIARSLQVRLGDEMVFDVQGLPVKTVVASLREVDWRRMQPNFFVVFPLGVLEEAPCFRVMVTRVGSTAKSAQMQREVVKQFPNVSAIDLTLVVQTVEGILRKVGFCDPVHGAVHAWHRVDCALGEHSCRQATAAARERSPAHARRVPETNPADPRCGIPGLGKPGSPHRDHPRGRGELGPRRACV